MITMTHLTLRDRFGILYWFAKRGEGLPLHTHRGLTAELAHDVLCTSGRLQVTIEQVSGAVQVHVLREGEGLALPDLAHEIGALEDGSSFLGIMHKGRPRGYTLLTESERCSRFESGRLIYPLRNEGNDVHTQPQPGAAHRG